MKRVALLTLTALLAVACQDQRVISPTIDGPNFLIEDGATDGNPDFWFLPPIVSNPQGDPEFERDEFNPDLMPVVEICEGAAGCGTEFPASLTGNHYQFNWQTSKSDAGTTFRVTVLASTGGFELGFFDADVSSKGKSAAPGNIPVKAGSNVPIKFSIENAALCYDGERPITQPCASKTFDLSQDNTLQLTDPTETIVSQLDVPAQNTTQVTTFTMQFCEDLNDRVIDLPTFGDCIKILPDPQLDNDLVDPALVSVCEFLPGGTTGLSEDQEVRVTLHQAAEDESKATALPDADNNCPQQIGSGSSNPIIRLAQAVRDWVAPTPLWANIMVLDRGGGGATSNFESDFQYALPAQMDYDDPDDEDRIAPPGDDLPVRVLVKDTGGDPVVGATVDFEIVDEGPGSLSAASDISDVNGIAEVSLTVGVGTTVVRASARGIADPDDPACDGETEGPCTVNGVFAPDHVPGPAADPVEVGEGTLDFTVRSVLFAEDFEGDLSQWVGKNGQVGSSSGLIVDDPIRDGNRVLTFTALIAAGDIFGSEVTVMAGERHVLSFEYLGDPDCEDEVCGVPGDLGGVIGFAEDTPGRHRWLAGTQTGGGIEADLLVDDGQWHTYTIEFDVFAGNVPGGVGNNPPLTAANPPNNNTIRVMLEDFVGSAGVAGDVFFDNIQVTLAPPEP